MSYIEYIYKDNLTNLEYINWDEYFEHKDEFNQCPNLTELFLNANIITDINKIDNDLFLLISAISMIVYDHEDINHDELIGYQNRITDLYIILRNYYEDSRHKKGFWKYIDISIDDIFNNITNESPFIVKDLTLDTIFKEDYYKFIFSLKEGKENE